MEASDLRWLEICKQEKGTTYMDILNHADRKSFTLM